MLSVKKGYLILDRQIEATYSNNWTIKAAIRGEVMIEVGVI